MRIWARFVAQMPLQMEISAVDVLDRQLLELLAVDGRASYRELGDQVGLSAPAVKRRVDRMIAAGHITGFAAVIDPAALGWDTEAYVEIHYRGNMSPQDLKRHLESMPQVVGAWTVAGEADAVAHVIAANMAEIERTVEQIRSSPYVDRTRSALVMSRLFDRPRT